MAESTENRIPNVLSIAGVDPSGGAGVFADIKAFSANGAFGTGVVTALTAQSTRGVTGILPIEPAFVRQQLDTLFDDVRIDAVKIGMLDNAKLIKTVAEVLKERKPTFVVLDPVMVAKSGDRLLQEEAVSALIEHLFPLATVLTPNLPEALALLGREDKIDEEDFPAVAVELWRMMKNRDAWVFLKGGHLESEYAYDLLVNGVLRVPYSAERIQTKNTHGTGCTLSSAIAAQLPQTPDVPEACRRAKEYLTGAIAAADKLNVGSGHGPTHHFWKMWSNSKM